MADAVTKKRKATQATSVPEPRPKQGTAENLPPNAAEMVDVWEGDFEGMDEVDRASAMSFPASDPPSFSEPG